VHLHGWRSWWTLVYRRTRRYMLQICEFVHRFVVSLHHVHRGITTPTENQESSIEASICLTIGYRELAWPVILANKAKSPLLTSPPSFAAMGWRDYVPFLGTGKPKEEVKPKKMCCACPETKVGFRMMPGAQGKSNAPLSPSHFTLLVMLPALLASPPTLREPSTRL
jgi:hypothetical protein